MIRENVTDSVLSAMKDSLGKGCSLRMRQTDYNRNIPVNTGFCDQGKESRIVVRVCNDLIVILS